MFNKTQYQRTGRYSGSSLIFYIVITDVFLCTVEHLHGNNLRELKYIIPVLKFINLHAVEFVNIKRLSD
jgi:hypothetical protein